jgi:hypothetical protein
MASVYQSLPERSIRFLKLHPHQDDGLISCSFSIQHINNEVSAPTYIALSYAWGRDHLTNHILIDDETVEVRQNLYEFLLQCGRWDAIWIDTLCINQEDSSEGSQQVQMMGSIYSSAQVVWAWLGPAHSRRTREALVNLRNNAAQYFLGLENVTEPDSMPENSYEVFSVCYLEYWTCAWVVQEFLLARKLQLLYGDTHIDPVILSRFRRAREQYDQVRCAMRSGRRLAVMQPQARDYHWLRGELQDKYGYVPSTEKRGLTLYMYSLCA